MIRAADLNNHAHNKAVGDYAEPGHDVKGKGFSSKISSSLYIQKKQFGEPAELLAVLKVIIRFRRILANPPTSSFPNSHLYANLGPGHYAPHPDDVVTVNIVSFHASHSGCEESAQNLRVTSEQSLTVCAPRQTHTLDLPALLSDNALVQLGLQLINLALLLQVEDDDAAGRCGA